MTVHAARAVILAAGSVNSPQLLQLSGSRIRARLLQQHGIATVLNLPAVGRNLQDHLGINYVYRCARPDAQQQAGYRGGERSRAGIRYALTRSGPLVDERQSGRWIRAQQSELRAPDMQLYFNPASYTATRERTRRLMNPDPFPGFITSFNACRPTSRGHLAIRIGGPPGGSGHLSQLPLDGAGSCATCAAGAAACSARLAAAPPLAARHRKGNAARDWIRPARRSCCRTSARAPARSSIRSAPA